jgi:Flp pilus assembly protein TadG
MRRLRLKSLVRDERGASLIEFGFLAPVLALMSMGIADLSRALSDRFSIQSAVNRSIELLQAHPVAIAATATNTSGNSTSSSCGNYCFVQTEAQTAAGTGATVTLTTWHECQDAAENTSMVSFDADCAGSTTSVGRYVRVKVDKTFRGGFFIGTIPMSTSGAVRVQ